MAQPSPIAASSVHLKLPLALYPADALLGAAYVLLDRCFVHLDEPETGRATVTLRAKPGAASTDVAGEFLNEALAQSWRRAILADNRASIEMISARAVSGAAGPPGLDDLLAMETSDQSAFDDPLGIAMSWEDKYKKKSEAAGEKGSKP